MLTRTGFAYEMRITNTIQIAVTTNILNGTAVKAALNSIKIV